LVGFSCFSPFSFPASISKLCTNSGKVDDEEDVFHFLCAATDEITTTHSLQFSFKTIEAATDKFSDSNMIGQGGFGEVYRVISSFSSWFATALYKV